MQETGMNEKGTTHAHLLGLFLLAVSLRLLYLKLASDHLGFDAFANYAEDTKLYLIIANHIFSWQPLGDHGLLRMGPGYGVILAAIKFVFGPSLLWPILCNILLGGLAPVLVYLLAYRLLTSRSIAVIAGGISAVSLTSIPLSCHVLTDQPFFTMFAATLLCFVVGYQSGRMKWFVLAGLIGGIAAYVRPVGQAAPLLFLIAVLVVPVIALYRSRWDLIRRGGVAGLVMLVVILSWSARNYAVDGLFVFGTNGVTTVRSCLLAQVASQTWGVRKSVREYRVEWEQADGERSANYPGTYEKAKARILQALKTQPGAMLWRYARNERDNMTAAHISLPRQIPMMAPFMSVFNRAMGAWLGYLLIVLTVAGVVVMAIRGHAFAAWLLGLTYVYFSLPVGLSIWQESRLHYPAEMAWAIVVSYLTVEACRGLMSLWPKRLKS